MKWASNKGFTVVELLVVMVVIAILATITLVSYNAVRRGADEAKITSYAGQIKNHLQAARALNNGKYYRQTTTYPLGSGLSSDFTDIESDKSVTTSYVSSSDQRKMCATVKIARGGFGGTISDLRGTGTILIEVQDGPPHCPSSL